MNEISQYLQEKKANFKELLLQVKKDVALAGIDADRFNNIENEEIFIDILCRFMDELLTYYPDSFSNFMYRIDVSEKSIFNQYQNNNLMDNICYLVIKREMQKVIYRKQFTNNKKA